MGKDKDVENKETKKENSGAEQKPADQSPAAGAKNDATEGKDDVSKEKEANASVVAPPLKSILATKLGMTRVFSSDGEVIPVTVLAAGPCQVLQVKTRGNDGYNAVQLGFGDRKLKNISKPLQGHLKKSNRAGVQWIREVRVPSIDGFEPGQVVSVKNFVKGDLVDVSGNNKGKGFAGVIKRHRFHKGPRTHGQSDRLRAPGSSGGQRPTRVHKGQRGPGQMGNVWSTVQRVQVVKIEPDDHLLILKGSVPGPNGSCVTVKATTRPRVVKKESKGTAVVKKSGKKN